MRHNALRAIEVWGIALLIPLIIGVVTPPAAAQTVDQQQELIDYSFWFERTLERWQVFVPEASSLCQLDLYLTRNGNPGNVIVEIKSAAGAVLWEGTIAQAQAVTGWNQVAISPSVGLTPGLAYSIHVRTDTDSASPSDRYFWRGGTASTYPGAADVTDGWPTYDYAFRTYYCGGVCHVDQQQPDVDYAFWFERTVERWQTFVPTARTLCQLDLRLERAGDPGNVLVDVQLASGALVWSGSIAQASATTGWNSLSVSPAVELTPGATYMIRVRSDADSASPSNRYFWRGSTTSTYPGTTDIASGWPGFDYAFRAYGSSCQCTADQAQLAADYSFWFERTVERWQTIVPTAPSLCQLFLNFNRVGSAGNVIVDVRTNSGTVVWAATIPEASVVTGWNLIEVRPPIGVVPGATYSIHVRTDADSASPSNRYFWRGSTASTYAGTTDVASGWPDFDYTFLAAGGTCPCAVDQQQDLADYGYWFERTVERSQNFIPAAVALCRLDLRIQRNGSAGNVLLDVRSGTGAVIWEGTIPEDLVIDGWNGVPVWPPVGLVAGATYSIHVRTDEDAADPSNRYFWRGYTASVYPGDSSVSSAIPGFDFGFRTYSARRVRARVSARSNDYDADGRSDLAVYRPSTGTWFWLESAAGFGDYSYKGWGVQASNDAPVPADYDGDGIIDPAVYRPATGTWLILKSSTAFSDWQWFGWGVATDVPLPGDYDGDSLADAAVYRPSSGVWYVRPADGSPPWSVGFGQATDVPVPGDYDGDGRTDIAVYRPSSGTWFILTSASGFTSYYYRGWGLLAQNDVPVPGDYDGDGKTDVTVYRPGTGTWFILKSSTGDLGYTYVGWGTATDTPVPADYDGDRITDVAVYRPSTGMWYVRPSSGAAPWSVVFGQADDIPLSRIR